MVLILEQLKNFNISPQLRDWDTYSSMGILTKRLFSGTFQYKQKLCEGSFAHHITKGILLIQNFPIILKKWA